MKIHRVLEKLLFLIAALTLGAYAYSWAERTIYQWHQSRSFNRLLKERAVRQRSEARPENSGEIQPQDLLGRIEIPRLGLSAMIVNGVNERALQLGVGHIPGTALPGQPGNVGLAGHRDTFFRPLRNIRDGDVIWLTAAAGVSEYIVESTAVIEPDRTQVLAASGSSVLTMVTCYPFDFLGRARKRFVVRARRLEAGRNSTVSRPLLQAPGREPTSDVG